MSELKVIWEKFKLPPVLGGDYNDDDEDEEDTYPSYKEDDDHPISKLISSQQNPFSQLQSFNMWMVHTNFVISKFAVRKSHRCNGIESMDVISPYRLFVSIGKAFDESEVKMTFQKKLIELAHAEQTQKSE